MIDAESRCCPSSSSFSELFRSMMNQMIRHPFLRACGNAPVRNRISSRPARHFSRLHNIHHSLRIGRWFVSYILLCLSDISQLDADRMIIIYFQPLLAQVLRKCSWVLYTENDVNSIRYEIYFCQCGGYLLLPHISLFLSSKAYWIDHEIPSSTFGLSNLSSHS